MRSNNLVLLPSGKVASMSCEGCSSNTLAGRRLSRVFVSAELNDGRGTVPLGSFIGSICSKNKFRVAEEAKNKVLYIINDAIFAEGDHFGNARFVRNLYEQTIQNQFLRVSQIENVDEDALCEIAPEDLPQN